jgi:hypothetical protein
VGAYRLQWNSIRLIKRPKKREKHTGEKNMNNQAQNNGQQNINPIEAVARYQGEMNDFCFQLKNWFSQMMAEIERSKAGTPNITQTPQGQFVEHNAQKN